MPSWILVDANVYPTYRLVFLFLNINSIDYVETNAKIIYSSIEYLTFQRLLHDICKYKIYHWNIDNDLLLDGYSEFDLQVSRSRFIATWMILTPVFK